ncbi:MAG TPA: hypothetical protein VM865_01205 [Acidobacteriaceae bacterium]|jgi:hypothetical protein|nr:hypothetical protein [Acidobacteriaceae bacterium]
MIDTTTEESLTTADIANSQRPTQINNAAVSATDRDPGFPDIRPEPVAPAANTNTAAGTSNLSGNQPGSHPALFPEAELRDLRGRWDQAQSSFVDEPRQAVQQADALVAATVKRIAEQFADERAQLEQQWDRGDNVSTEDLRQALKRYRSFFDRLLSF